MSRSSRVYLAVPFLLACAIILTLGVSVRGNRSHAATPVHQAAVFFDGINHGDYRAACAVWEAARKNTARCESGLTVQMATSALYGEFGGYKIVAHSEKVWQTGQIEYATVQAVYLPSRGQKVVAHLRKRAGGPWLLWWVG